MENDSLEMQLSFQIISVAGDAHSNAVLAMESARNGKIDDAKKLMETADASLNEAHKYQTQLLVREAQGTKSELSVILIHAQDHLSMATVSYENAKEVIYLYETLYKLKEEKEK